MKRYIRAAVVDVSDEDDTLKLSIAEDPNTRPSTLKTLANDKHWSIRSAVAENPNTPTDVLQTLTNDPDLDVRTAATTSMYSRGAI